MMLPSGRKGGLCNRGLEMHFGTSVKSTSAYCAARHSASECMGRFCEIMTTRCGVSGAATSGCKKASTGQNDDQVFLSSMASGELQPQRKVHAL